MQIKKSSKEYDVIIVGSGAGGGMATKILSEAGLKIAVVEAGPHFDPADPGAPNPDEMAMGVPTARSRFDETLWRF
jgi:choline dehydrogenase-like flavoprotein